MVQQTHDLGVDTNLREVWEGVNKTSCDITRGWEHIFWKFWQMKRRAGRSFFISKDNHWKDRGKYYCLTNSAQYGTFDNIMRCINLFFFLVADLIAYTFGVLQQLWPGRFNIYKVTVAVDTFFCVTRNHQVQGPRPPDTIWPQHCSSGVLLVYSPVI